MAVIILKMEADMFDFWWEINDGRIWHFRGCEFVESIPPDEGLTPLMENGITGGLEALRRRVLEYGTAKNLGELTTLRDQMNMERDGLISQLAAIDEKSLRALRAILTEKDCQEDKERLIALETEATQLRTALALVEKGLKDEQN